jgi:hypothetical protein
VRWSANLQNQNSSLEVFLIIILTDHNFYEIDESGWSFLISLASGRKHKATIRVNSANYIINNFFKLKDTFRLPNVLYLRYKWEPLSLLHLWYSKLSVRKKLNYPECMKNKINIWTLNDQVCNRFLSYSLIWKAIRTLKNSYLEVVLLIRECSYFFTLLF